MPTGGQSVNNLSHLNAGFLQKFRTGQGHKVRTSEVCRGRAWPFADFAGQDHGKFWNRLDPQSKEMGLVGVPICPGLGVSRVRVRRVYWSRHPAVLRVRFLPPGVSLLGESGQNGPF